MCCVVARCRWLWFAVQRSAWTLEQHASFPPAFRAAARTFMLAAHRHSSGGGLPAAQQAATAAAARHHPLGTLPQAVLENIVGLAAYPLSAWAWLRAGGS